VLQGTLALRKEKNRLSEAEFQAQFRALKERLDALIAEEQKLSNLDNARMYKRLRKHQENLFTFLREWSPVATWRRSAASSGDRAQDQGVATGRPGKQGPTRCWRAR